MSQRWSDSAGQKADSAFFVYQPCNCVSANIIVASSYRKKRCCPFKCFHQFWWRGNLHISSSLPLQESWVRMWRLLVRPPQTRRTKPKREKVGGRRSSPKGQVRPIFTPRTGEKYYHREHMALHLNDAKQQAFCLMNLFFFFYIENPFKHFSLNPL